MPDVESKLATFTEAIDDIAGQAVDGKLAKVDGVDELVSSAEVCGLTEALSSHRFAVRERCGASPARLKEAPREVHTVSPLGAKAQGVKGAEPTLRLERRPVGLGRPALQAKSYARPSRDVFAMGQYPFLVSRHNEIKSSDKCKRANDQRHSADDFTLHLSLLFSLVSLVPFSLCRDWTGV